MDPQSLAMWISPLLRVHPMSDHGVPASSLHNVLTLPDRELRAAAAVPAAYRPLGSISPGKVSGNSSLLYSLHRCLSDQAVSKTGADHDQEMSRRGVALRRIGRHSIPFRCGLDFILDGSDCISRHWKRLRCMELWAMKSQLQKAPRLLDLVNGNGTTSFPQLAADPWATPPKHTLTFQCPRHRPHLVLQHSKANISARGGGGRG